MILVNNFIVTAKKRRVRAKGLEHTRAGDVLRIHVNLGTGGGHRQNVVSCMNCRTNEVCRKTELKMEKALGAFDLIEMEEAVTRSKLKAALLGVGE